MRCMRKSMRWNKINQKQQISSYLKWENKLKKNFRKHSPFDFYFHKRVSSNLFVTRRKSIGS